MTYTCRPFYSMQKIFKLGTNKDFHRKFGQLTEGKRGVYIWGFAKEFYQIQDDSETIDASMKQFEVQVSSENIGIYYVGKVESMNLNIFERIMQERANLFGGFSTVFEWDTYFHNTPMLHMHAQLGDSDSREKKKEKSSRFEKHFSNLERYEKCSQNEIFSSSPILYSNSCFNENNLYDRITNRKSCKDIDLQKSLSNMSMNFIFTWIEIKDEKGKKNDIKKLESELIQCLGVNTFGIGSKYALNFVNPDSLAELKKVNWKANNALKKRIMDINKKSLELKNSPCRCFK